MTEKRYRVICDEINAYSIFKDNERIVFDLLKYDAERICDELNQVAEENKQLKTQIKIFEKFLNENNLDIDWEIFCTVDECKKDSDDYGCKECKYLGDVE